MREEIINGVAYRIGRLNARQQFHVVRRLGPVLTSAGPALQKWAGTANLDQGVAAFAASDELVGLFDALGPLATALAEMTDETSDYVLNICLSACQRNTTGQTWANVATASGQVMFADLSMATMLRLTLLVLQENVSDFLGEILGDSSAASPPAA